MKLERFFAQMKGAAFMPYVCCGDPSEKFTLRLVRTLVESGADAIEFGIPFSDPIADGKAIQAASQRALAAGMTPKRAIAAIAKLRKMGIRVPIITMTYYNIVYSGGTEAFIASIKKAGADGLIVPDVPLEESGELRAACRNAGIGLIYFITPNCSTKRLKKIASRASGFLYAVSVLGTTGARKTVSSDALELVRRARKACSLPVVAGFGISEPSHAAALREAGADGVIVGSRLVEIYGLEKNERSALEKVGRFARKMKKACNAER